MSNEVTIIIVSHYSARDLKRCLPSIEKASTSPTPTIVVDNATRDDSVADVVQQFPAVTLIASDVNLGYGKAINLAARQADTPWVLVANPDTEFHAGAIDALVAAAHANPRTGSAGPRIMNEDGSVYPSARAIPSIRNGVGHALFRRLWQSNPWSDAYLQARKTLQSATPIPTGWLSGACVLVDTALYRDLGGFDPRFFMYFEDVDLGERIHKAGYTNLYVPASVVTHVGGTSTQRYSKRMRAIHHRSAYLYMAKRHNAWYAWPLRVALRAGLALRNALGR